MTIVAIYDISTFITLRWPNLSRQYQKFLKRSYTVSPHSTNNRECEKKAIGDSRPLQLSDKFIEILYELARLVFAYATAVVIAFDIP